jgi:hypothetical protein
LLPSFFGLRFAPGKSFPSVVNEGQMDNSLVRHLLAPLLMKTTTRALRNSHVTGKSGATRSYNAGNISKGEETKIKGKARGLLGMVGKK